MTNLQILIKAIEKAKKNGWNNQYSHYTHEPIKWMGFKRYYVLIFDHQFAKAFFGINEFTDPITSITMEAWQYHLQIIVLEDNPIKYLEKFLDKTNT